MNRLKDIFGKIIGISLLFGFFAGLIAVVFVSVEMSKMAEAQTWPSRSGIITQSSASEVFSKRRGSYWTYVIRGTFTDTGEPFVITKVRYGDFSLGKGKSIKPGNRRQIFARQRSSSFLFARTSAQHDSGAFRIME